MPRPKKYHTQEEIKAAARADQARYRAAHPSNKKARTLTILETVKEIEKKIDLLISFKSEELR